MMTIQMSSWEYFTQDVGAKSASKSQYFNLSLHYQQIFILIGFLQQSLADCVSSSGYETAQNA